MNDAMADLGLDEGLPQGLPLEAECRDSRSRRATGKGSRSRGASGKVGPRPPERLTLQLPQNLRDSGHCEVTVLSRPPGLTNSKGVVWVRAKGVPWVTQILHQQYASGGVDYKPAPARLSQPFFALRDRSWQARAQTPAGDWKRRSFVVSRRVSTSDGRSAFASPAEFQAEKERVLKLALDWQSEVQAGMDPDI